MGLYVVLGVVALLATWYLWRARPEEDSSANLPPGLLPGPGTGSRTRTPGTTPGPTGATRVTTATTATKQDSAGSEDSTDSEDSADDEEDDDSDDSDDSAQSPVASEPASVSDDSVQGAVARLVSESSYLLDKNHKDCRILIRAGVESLHALYAAVAAKEDRWVHLYQPMAIVADELGPAGYGTFAELLARSVTEHHSRMTSFLDYAASKMKPALLSSLIARVDGETADAFGDAAAHHGNKVFKTIVEQLGAASGSQAEVLRQLLTGFLGSLSLPDRAIWKRALSHKNPRVRAAAVLAANERDGEADIVPLAKDPDEEVRWAVVSGDEDVANDTLLPLTSDPSPRVRAFAARKLEGGSQEVVQTYQRLLSDPHPAVALMAAVGLDSEDDEPAAAPHTKSPLDDRIVAALASRDPLLREVGAQVACFLSVPTYCATLRELAHSGSPAEIAAALEGADDEPEVMDAIAELMLGNPKTAVLCAGQIQLAFSECPAAIDAAVRLLPATLPARVRRAGFYSLIPHHEAWPQHLEPLLRPEEPLLADLLNQLDIGLIGDDPIDLPMFQRIRAKYPGTPLADLAEKALKRE